MPYHARPPEGGFTVLELLLVLAITGLVLALAVPPIQQFSLGVQTDLAASQVAAAFRHARGWSIRHRAKVGVKFETDDRGEVSWGLYRDGDGDGVRTADIESGVDPLVRRPLPLSHFDARVRLGIPEGWRPTHPSNSGRRLGRLEDPVRFGRGDLAAFDPRGTASPGTVYVTDGHHLFAVRVHHLTGRIRIVRYDRERELWR